MKKYAQLQKNNKYNKAFTIVELLIVLAIAVLLVAVTNFSFSQLSGGQAVDKATLSVISILNDAKSKATAGKDASDFGVRILKNKIIFFEGSTYATLTASSSYIFSNLVAISTSTGIGTDIIFNNLYGNTAASGTINVYLIANQKTSSTIQIFSTGDIQRN